ncbi:MAG: hypothetical protein ACRDQ7_15190 [Haloechinothrix sp.]
MTVETRDDPAQGALRRRDPAEDLWFEGELSRGAVQPGELMRIVRERPDPAWSTMKITMEGAARDFQWLAEGRRWVAVAEVDGYELVLSADDFPVESVELVRITDLEPYVEGDALLADRMAASKGEAS